MIWPSLVHSLANKQPLPPPESPETEFKVFSNEIAELLEQAKGKCMTTRQVAEAQQVTTAVAYKRLYRMRKVGRVVTISVGPNESAIWKLK